MANAKSTLDKKPSRTRQAASGKNRSSSKEADAVLSLKGEAGKDVALNLLRVGTGEISPRDLGPGYFVAADGTIGITVDDDTFEALEQAK